MSLLFAYDVNRYSYDMAHIYLTVGVGKYFFEYSRLFI